METTGWIFQCRGRFSRYARGPIFSTTMNGPANCGPSLRPSTSIWGMEYPRWRRSMTSCPVSKSLAWWFPSKYIFIAAWAILIAFAASIRVVKSWGQVFSIVIDQVRKPAWLFIQWLYHCLTDEYCECCEIAGRLERRCSVYMFCQGNPKAFEYLPSSDWMTSLT